ncbi:hypothetical protein ACH5RR_029243 [Cinchona calisaya]|uniref:RNase H type-1 domain-containing protein n=1 Tax=Cinchona calisaya TaxID=153742 RepID=A0ABD2YUD5_9GENT
MIWAHMVLQQLQEWWIMANTGADSCGHVLGGLEGLCGASLSFARPKKKRVAEVVRWSKPPNQLLKLNMDRSLIGNLGSQVGGCLDKMRLVLIASSKFFGHGSSLAAEIKSLLCGLELCSQNWLIPQVVELDSKLVVGILLKRVSYP